MTTLLELPSEIRNQIWSLVLSHRSVTPEPLANFSQDSCTPCKNNEDLPERWNDVFRCLLSCKQIYQEAQDILFNTMTLVLSSHEIIERLLSAKWKVLSRYSNSDLYIHLNEENRIEWAVASLNLTQDSPKLTNLTLYNHMRPPISYEHLVDGLFFAVPLVSMPRRISPTLKFDYIYEDVMFASPFLGEIKCSDALEEHELVIRDLLVDEEFNAAAAVRDLEVMTGALLRIARSHEQPWFAKLQRRRLAELARREQGQSGGQGGEESGSSSSSE